METSNRISPEEYGRILSGIRLYDIALRAASTSFHGDQIAVEGLTFKISDEDEYEADKDGEVIIHHTFKLLCSHKKRKYFTVNATFRVTLHSENEFTSDFYKIYAKTSLRLQTWPYFREYVQNVTSRMNIPPLTLPLYKSQE